MKSGKVTLRHAKMSDAKILFEIEIDKDNIKNMMSHTTDIKEIEKELKKKISKYRLKKPDSETFMIDFEGNPAGYISIHDLNQPRVEHTGIISYALHPNFRGKGITTIAVKLTVKHAFKKYKLKRLTARCRTFNKASAIILEKAGFTFEGTHRKELKKNGKYLDNMYWAIVK